jgi:hypothetical protein
MGSEVPPQAEIDRRKETRSGFQKHLYELDHEAREFTGVSGQIVYETRF